MELKGKAYIYNLGRENGYNKAIDTFSHELKELFNRETPLDIDENTAYFALDDVRMWIDVIAEEIKTGESE